MCRIYIYFSENHTLLTYLIDLINKQKKIEPKYHIFRLWMNYFADVHEYCWVESKITLQSLPNTER